MGITSQLNRVEIEIARLRREFEKYFAGANDLPPRDLEKQLVTQIQALKTSSRGAADQFRVNSLEASFSSYREMYGRKVRDLEEGRTKRGSATGEPDLPDPLAGVRVVDGVSEKAALSLYQGLYSNTDAPPVGLPQFHRYLEQQLDRIQGKTGCEGLVFRLAEKDGKRRLKAKPIRK